MTDAVDAVLDVLGGQADPSLRVLAERTFRYLSWDDVRGFTPAILTAHLEHLRTVAEERAAGRSTVEVRNAAGTEFTVATVITDDAPFLVDSIVGALQVENRSPRLVVHPQVVVRRDGDGRLIELLDLDSDDPRPADAQVEAWIQVELERDYLHEDNRRTADHLRRVLRDVQASIADWAAMREQALEVAAALVDGPTTGWDPVEVAESAALLRWMADEHFLFLGYREYALVPTDGTEALEELESTGLGILRPRTAAGEGQVEPEVFALSPLAQQHAHDAHPLVLTKANSRSTVHRTAYLDYVGVRVLDADGTVIGERRFLGLYTGSAFTDSVLTIPILRTRFDRMMAAMDIAPGSHSARDLRQFIETFPRDEFFTMHTSQLVELATSVIHLAERRQVKVYVRPDDFGRYVSAFVYLPRDHYDTDARLRIQGILRDYYDASTVDHSVQVTEAPHARLHFVAHLRDGATVPQTSVDELERMIELTVRTWADEFTAEAVAAVGSRDVASFLHQFIDAFPEGYKAACDARVGVQDALTISRLTEGELVVEFERDELVGRSARIRLIRIGEAMSLSQVLPMLQHLGVQVLSEYPYEVRRDGFPPAWILDFGVDLPEGALLGADTLAQRCIDAFRAVWFGHAESDDFNGLVLRAGITWQQAALLRAYARYLRQIGTAFGQDYIQRVLLAYPAIAALLIELFDRLFDPDFTGDREAHAADVAGRIRAALDDVPVLDHDRILRSFLALIGATLRTSAFQVAGQLDTRAVAFKLDSRALPDMPLPVPLVEIWVYSPRVEGVHLRFGRVARGGLRWSDRREDFRTEILGLVKAQEVKNAVIVPVGAKGGFVPASLPDPARDREGWLAAGTAAYREFVSALLDLTDNLHGELVVPPADVVRRDGDDPYLVVAADKGTASFSDTANAIAVERGFWLGDAFASGGSRGYDHKAMGITARGAWISVQRHFRELGINTQADAFTAVGIGDMSGDVFGNGMLLSDRIRLVAAFDHRDIFIDPDPDPEATLAERLRLFRLPRSSWADFDPALISEGGAVLSRSAKSVELSARACEVLGLDGAQRVLTPNDVIRAILRAPVDLLWNGGIGTYVKAAGESHVQVGDKANDAIRINGADLRCRVVGEGGNLGFTQLGRVEAARAGVRLNTDAIDNSAGVDTSDHEVNLKILLDAMVRSGEITEDRRNEVLVALTDEVAADVLADNYDQNVVLGNSRAAAVVMLPVHQRMIRDLERRGLLDRSVEFLPSDEEIEQRRVIGQGLTSPELSVLLAYAKISLMGELHGSSLAQDPWYASALDSYFPSAVSRDFPEAVARHQLRSQIITTVVCNDVINTGGITFVFRACEETSASPTEVVHAARAASEIFGIRQLAQRVRDLDSVVPTAAQDALNLGIRRLLDRATRWILHAHGDHLSPQDVVARYRPVVDEHGAYVRTHLPEGIDEAVLAATARYVSLGAPQELAHEVAALLDVYALLDITDVAGRTGVDPARIIPVYFAVIESYGINALFLAITALPRSDRWGMLARQALRADLYSTTAALAENVLRMDQGSTALTLAAWEGHYASSAARAKATLLDIAAVESPDLATLSVALRVLRSLVAQTREA